MRLFAFAGVDLVPTVAELFEDVLDLLDLLLVAGLMLLLAQVFRYALHVDNLIPWVVASLTSLLVYVFRRRF